MKHSMQSPVIVAACLTSLGLGVVACEAESESFDAEHSLLEGEGEDPNKDVADDAPEVISAPIAEVELPGGGSLTFTNPVDDAVIVTFSAPEDTTSNFPQIMTEFEPTPLELMLNFAPEAEVPEVLWANHEAEVEAKGLDDYAPRTFDVPRITTFPAFGNAVYECDTGSWQDDWNWSFSHRDHALSTFRNSQHMPSNGTYQTFYSGNEPVQRVHWGVCSNRINEQPGPGNPAVEGEGSDVIAGVQYKVFVRNGAFNGGCGNSGWTAVTGFNSVRENRYNIRYYYAGAVADLTCIRVHREPIGLGEHHIRSFGVGVAYDEAQGIAR